MDWRIVLAVITFLIAVAGILFAGHLFIEFLDKILHDHLQ